VQHKIFTWSSVLYDAVILPSKTDIDRLIKEVAVREFITDAFIILKFIGYIKESCSY